MAALSPDHILTIWEQGSRRHALDRALLLLAFAEPGLPAERLADAPLGRRNAALMALRSACFGDRLAVWCDCRACGERMDVELDIAQFPPHPAGDGASIEAGGHRFRRITSRDLAWIDGDPDAAHAARRLLAGCAESPGDLPQDAAELDTLLGEVGAAMDAADPWADVSLAVQCPSCGHDDDLALDIAGILWEELESLAHGVLGDVHALATAYGWSEHDILGMSGVRRAAYLAWVRP